MKKLLTAAAILLCMAAMTACSTTSSESFDPAKNDAWAEKIVAEQMPGDLSGITPYGRFQRYTYFSTTAGRNTNVNVLLPPGYTTEKQYPVVYVLHGYFGDENAMTIDAFGITRMLTKFYAENKAKEMIVVCPYIFTSKELPRCTGMNLENSLAYDNFINDLFTDLKPYIEKTFSVKKGRMNTAITGFSMGGRESMFIGFQRPEEFGYLGAVCPAPGLTPLANSAAHPGQMKDAEMKFKEGFSPRFFLLTAGQSDRTVHDTPVGYHNTMVSNGVKHLWSYLPNADHNETSVKPHLYQFFQLVFQ